MTQSDSSVEIIPALEYDLNEFEYTTVAEREAAAEAEKAEQEAELAAEQEAKEKEMEEEVEAALKEKEESSDETDDSGVIEGFDEYIADSGADGEQYEMIEGTQSNLDELPETGLFSDGDANMIPSILLGLVGIWVIGVMFLREKLSKE